MTRDTVDDGMERKALAERSEPAVFTEPIMEPA
jgi:hypothetical protein